MIPVSALGALAALSIAIFLILKKVPPAYGMIVGALAGGLIGGAAPPARGRSAPPIRPPARGPAILP